VSVPLPTTPGTTTANAWAPSGMTLAQANDQQERLAAETIRLSSLIDDAQAAPARDGTFVLNSLLGSVLADPHRSNALRADAETLDLDGDQIELIAAALGRSGEQLNRFDVLAAPDQVLEAATGRSGADLTRLRLEAATLPTTRGR